ncbi:MAG: hypothetical protein ACI9N0_000695 [Ilumatobacter sp.]
MLSRAVPFAILGSLLFVACSGGSDADTSTTSTTVSVVEAPVATAAPTVTESPVTTTTVPLVFDGATVVVANGNIVGGSAGRMTDALVLAGFTTGTAVNGSEKVEESIVYYTAAAGAQDVAETLAITLGGIAVEALPNEAPTEDGTLAGGQVLLLLGNNEADQPLTELASGSTDATSAAIANGGSTIVVANANTTSGSAGRMSSVLETAGFTVAVPANSTAQASESVVYYANEAALADAEVLATALGGVTVLALPDDVPTTSGSLDGDILLLLGSNEADKSLAQLAS